MRAKYIISFLLIIATGSIQLRAQEAEKKTDTLVVDSVRQVKLPGGKMMNKDGFVVLPIIITEPALGGFGGGLVPIHMKKRPPYIDSVKGKRIVTPVAPDITGAAGFYTVNKTWMVAGFRSGTLVKSRIKYVIGGGYAYLNMSFYEDLGKEEETEFAFNFKTVPVMVQAIKRIRYSHWYAGLKYLFLKTELQYVGDPLLPPGFVTPKEHSSTVSDVGAIIELDNRDNIFTPDKGMKVHFEAVCSDNVLGSDYDFWTVNYYMYAYKTLVKKLVGGWKVDAQQAFGDQPFYLKPYISLRGIPVARYQGEAALMTELELRWDFYRKWSAVGFGGTGKAFDAWEEFGNEKLISSGGLGFRYLIAKDFKLRVGLDFAYGPNNTFAYYIVFGSSWLK